MLLSTYTLYNRVNVRQCEVMSLRGTSFSYSEFAPNVHQAYLHYSAAKFNIVIVNNLKLVYL